MKLKEIFDRYGQVKVINTNTGKIYKLISYVNDNSWICAENRGKNDNYSHITVFSINNKLFKVYQPSTITQSPNTKFKLGDVVKSIHNNDIYEIVYLNSDGQHCTTFHIKNSKLHHKVELKTLELVNKSNDIKPKKESGDDIEKFTEQTFEKFNFVTDW